MSESSKLIEFFLHLEEDSYAFARYKENPARELKQFGLSPSTVKAIVSGDLRQIRKIMWGRARPSIEEMEFLVVVSVKRTSRRKTRRSR